MLQTLAQTTSTAPDYGVETIQTPIKTVSRPQVPEGIRAWLPALVILVAMPLLALTTTRYVLLPPVRQAFAPSSALPSPFVASPNIPSLYTPNMFLARIPFNVSGIRSLGLIGADSNFKDKVNQNKAKLTGLAAIELGDITATDLYKPGVLNPLRAKLRADFNRALGEPLVNEVYIALWPEK